MEIRELKSGDAKRLSELIISVYEENPASMTFKAAPSEEELNAVISKKLEGMKKGSVIDMVAADGSKLIADCEMVASGGGLALIGIIVAKGYRGNEVGKELLESCVKEASLRGIRKIYAEIRRENEAAVRFFSKCGFREIGTQTEKEGIRLMVLELR